MWIVIVTLVFTGQVGAHEVQRPCKDIECVYETMWMAESDPYAIRIMVLAPGNARAGTSGATFFPPVLDWWKQ